MGIVFMLCVFISSVDVMQTAKGNYLGLISFAKHEGCGRGRTAHTAAPSSSMSSRPLASHDEGGGVIRALPCCIFP